MSEELKVVCDVVRKDRFRLKPGPKTLARQREFCRSQEFEMDLVLGRHAGYPEKIDENEIVKRVEELEPCILPRFSRPGLVEVVKTLRRDRAVTPCLQSSGPRSSIINFHRSTLSTSSHRLCDDGPRQHCYT
jgi:hypothetical protein